jgi:cupin fold WbuC family metalloprotein
MMNDRMINKEVYAAIKPIVLVADQQVDFLTKKAACNPSGKCRLLLHGDPESELHQMLIVHSRGKYIQPHINEVSAKSFHMVRGAMTCVFFDVWGTISASHALGEAGDDRPFLLRVSDKRYHSLITETETAVFLETILGPFQGTTYASWAPEPNTKEAEKYFENICRQVDIRNYK